MVDIKELERISDQALAAVGYDVVDLEFTREPQGWILRVFIDHPHEGPADRAAPPSVRITHEDCLKASRQLGTVLDVEDPIGSAYRLELSSPGVLRPLSKLRDFRRFVGFAVRVKLDRPLEGQRNFNGTLIAVDDADEGPVLVVDGEGRQHVLPFSLVQKARLDEEF